MPKVKKPVKLIIFIGFCLSVGAIGSLFTTSSIPTWYATLVKPSFSPPNWIFGPIWTILYILMGISAYIIAQTKNKLATAALKLFWIHLIVNFAWSYLFFGLRNPFYGLVCILVLWSLIVAVILRFSKINKMSAWLLSPYIMWVSFATFLNYDIWILNR